MANKKDTVAEVSKEQILLIISGIEFACSTLLALIPILKSLMGKLSK